MRLSRASQAMATLSHIQREQVCLISRTMSVNRVVTTNQTVRKHSLWLRLFAIELTYCRPCGRLWRHLSAKAKSSHWECQTSASRRCVKGVFIFRVVHTSQASAGFCLGSNPNSPDSIRGLQDNWWFSNSKSRFIKKCKKESIREADLRFWS